MVIAAHQALTRQWWDRRGSAFDLLVSELVREEIARGDPEAATRRIDLIGDLPILAVNGVDYLLTWNCKHLANAVHRNAIEFLVEKAGYACPVICTPEELMED